MVDPSGAAVPGAAVDLFLPGGSSPVAATKTNSQGIFNLVSIRPDTYTLTIQSQGFAKASVERLSIDPGKDSNVPPISLQLATSSQAVEVTEAAGAVQTSSFEVATTITSQQVENLPVLDRQITNLFATQAGVSQNNSGGNTVINGLRSQMTNITLDGINVQDNFIRVGALDYLPNQLTIAQVQDLTISSANAPTNYGLGASQITLTTPSGGNQFHGSGYFYNRNSRVAAADWFANFNGIGKSFLNLNQIGGTFGGPILKDKLFFYLAYEAYRSRQTKQQLNTVLTPSARNGVFTYQAYDANGNPTSIQTFNVLQATGSSIDPYIAGLISTLPLPNSTSTGDGLNTGGYAFQARDNETRDNAQGRVDYVMSEKNTLFGTYAWNRQIVDRPDIDTFFSAVPPYSNNNYAKLLSIGWRSSFTPNLTNELRGGFNIAPGVFDVSFGIPKFYLTGGLFSVTGDTSQFAPQGRDTDTFSIQDNANWYKGKHSLSFGYQQQNIRVGSFDNNNDVAPLYTIGFGPSNTSGLTQDQISGVTSNDLNTANTLLATLQGLVGSYQQVFNVTSRTSGFVPGAANKRHFEFSTYSGYVTDKWQMSRKLTAILGLRYDYFTPLNERDSLFLTPELVNNNYIQTVLSNATLNFAGNSVGRPYYHANKNDFSPNVGFAWDVFGNGKTAIRGGYSISYVNDDLIIAAQNYIGTNSGLQSTASNPDSAVFISQGVPALPTPALQVPRTFADNYALDPFANAEGIIDPNLKTPYVQQYSIGVQQEFKGFTIDARYVGNHGVHELRGIDFNQVRVAGTPYLADFLRARSNLFLSEKAGLGNDPTYNPSVAGSQPLTFLPQLPDGGLLNSSSVRNLISTGQPGALGLTYQQDLLPGLNGGYSFFPNPYGYGMNALSNPSSSSYNAAQLDIRRRLTRGQQLQFNYTYSKALSDANGDLNNDRFEPYLDINNGHLDRARAPFDLTHSLKANYVLPIPFGRGHRFGNNTAVNAVLGGWTFSGFLTYQSGSPFSIVSRRGTLNRGGSRATYNTVDTNLTRSQLDNLFGVFKTGSGIYFINPSAISPTTGRGVAPDGAAPFSGQVFFDPQPGTYGSLQRRAFTGPWFFDWDAQLAKQFRLTERLHLDVQAAFFNLTNHPNFTVGQDGDTSATNYNVNQTNFGKIVSTVPNGNPRLIQFGAYLRF